MKVQIENKLYLESDSQQFILKEYVGRFDDKGNEQYKVHGYFPGVQYALKHFMKMKVMASTAKTLDELQRDIKNIREYIEKAFDL